MLKTVPKIHRRKYILSPRQPLTYTVCANRNIENRKGLKYINGRERQWQNLWKSATWCWKVCFILGRHIEIELSWSSQIKLWRNYVTSGSGIVSDICQWKWRNCRLKKIHGGWPWRWMDGYEYIRQNAKTIVATFTFCTVIWGRLIYIDMPLYIFKCILVTSTLQHPMKIVKNFVNLV